MIIFVLDYCDADQRCACHFSRASDLVYSKEWLVCPQFQRKYSLREEIKLY